MPAGTHALPGWKGRAVGAGVVERLAGAGTTAVTILAGTPAPAVLGSAANV
jgi:predicted aconitase with swiveling domain